MMREQVGGEDATMTRPIHSVFFAHSQEKSLSTSLVCCMSLSARSTWKCLEIFRESKLLTSRIPRETPHGMVWSRPSGPLELLYVMRMLHLHRKLCSSRQSLKCQLGRSSVKVLKCGHHAASHSVNFSRHPKHGPFNFVKHGRKLCMMEILAPLEILAWLISVHQTRSEPWRSIQPGKRVVGNFSCASCRRGSRPKKTSSSMMPNLCWTAVNSENLEKDSSFAEGVCCCFIK